MFESLLPVVSKNKVENIPSKKVTPAEKRQHRIEAAAEGLIGGVIGNLLKSGATKQKERVEKAIATIDEIKKKNSTEHIASVKWCTTNFSKYSKDMAEVASSIKNKKFDAEAYKKLIVPDWTFYFRVIKGDMDNHAKIRSLVEKLFTDSNIDVALDALKKAPAYTWYEDPDPDEYVDEDETVSASAAGYPSDFISYALSTVNITKQAMDAMLSLSARTGALIEKQKTSITPTTGPVDLANIIHRCREIDDNIIYYTDAVTDDHRFHEFLYMAKLFSKHCYK